MEYSDRMDAQIAELLSSRTRVTPAHLPGVPDEEGAALLKHYAEIHGADEHVMWDGRRLVRERPAAVDAADSGTKPDTPESVTPAASRPQPSPTTSGPKAEESGPKPSPVDEILAASVDKSLLDSAPSGKVSSWLWLLPFLFALPGGLIAWLIVRDTDRSVARAMLITGAVMTVFWIFAGAGFQSVGERMGSIIEQSR